jgi:hypothetical protein
MPYVPRNLKVFISWSGDLSREVAELLSAWLEDVLQNTKAWLSEAGLEKGSIWFDEVAKQLSDTGVGVLCVTRSNQDAPWVLFEAGALCKGLAKNRVCPFLVDLEPTELRQPLSQFNGTRPTKDDVLKLVKTINNTDKEHARSDTQLDKAFSKWWPDFEKRFTEIIANHKPKQEVQKRTVPDMVEEVLELSRSIQRSLQQPLPQEPPFALPPWAELGMIYAPPPGMPLKRSTERPPLSPEDMERMKRILEAKEKDKSPN